MIPYWIMFILACSTALEAGRKKIASLPRPYFLLVSAIFAAMIGLRHQVGGDWRSYLYMYERARWLSIDAVLYRASRDPGYSLFNWLSVQFDGGVYLVNFFVGVVLMAGIARFAFKQPLPWLVLVASVPYLIIVIGMGYSRQAAAIGLVLVALPYLSRNDARKFVLWVLLGALFHKSAVVVLPLAALTSKRNRWWRFSWVGVTGAAAAYFLIGDAGEHMWEHYVERERDSSGALIRVLMNAAAGTVFLYFRKSVSDGIYESKLYTAMSLGALACVPLSLLASTATDRAALYLIPLQLYVCGRANRVIPGSRTPVTAAIGLYFMVQYVWLNYASHAFAWVPYQIKP